MNPFHFPELYRTGKRGPVTSKSPPLYAVTAEAAERQRQNLTAANVSCWNCLRPAGPDAWMMVRLILRAPTGSLVCSDCIERVRRRRSGLHLRWFPPMERTP